MDFASKMKAFRAEHHHTGVNLDIDPDTVAPYIDHLAGQRIDRRKLIWFMLKHNLGLHAAIIALATSGVAKVAGVNTAPSVALGLGTGVASFEWMKKNRRSVFPFE